VEFPCILHSSSISRRKLQDNSHHPCIASQTQRTITKSGLSMNLVLFIINIQTLAPFLRVESCISETSSDPNLDSTIPIFDSCDSGGKLFAIDGMQHKNKIGTRNLRKCPIRFVKNSRTVDTVKRFYRILDLLGTGIFVQNQKCQTVPLQERKFQSIYYRNWKLSESDCYAGCSHSRLPHSSRFADQFQPTPFQLIFPKEGNCIWANIQKFLRNLNQSL